MRKFVNSFKSLEIYMVNHFKALRKIAVIDWRNDQSFSWSTQEKQRLFDCDWQQLQNDEVNVESKSDDNSKNNEDEKAANTAADNEKKPKS